MSFFSNSPICHLSLAKLSEIDPHENVVDRCKGCSSGFPKKGHIRPKKAKNAFYISNLHTYHVAGSGLACDVKEEII